MDAHEWYDQYMAQELAQAPKTNETNLEAFLRTLRKGLEHNGSEAFSRLLLSILSDPEEMGLDTSERIENLFNALNPYEDSVLRKLEYRKGPITIKANFIVEDTDNAN